MRILESKLASTSEPDEQEEAKTDLCSALCSLAELMIGGASGDLSSVEVSAMWCLCTRYPTHACHDTLWNR